MAQNYDKSYQELLRLARESEQTVRTLSSIGKKIEDTNRKIALFNKDQEKLALDARRALEQKGVAEETRKKGAEAIEAIMRTNEATLKILHKELADFSKQEKQYSQTMGQINKRMDQQRAEVAKLSKDIEKQTREIEAQREVARKQYWSKGEDRSAPKQTKARRAARSKNKKYRDASSKTTNNQRDSHPLITQALGSIEDFTRRARAERKQLLEDLRAAREFGDLKENAEYHAAKTDLEKLEKESADLHNLRRKIEKLNKDSIKKIKDGEKERYIVPPTVSQVLRAISSEFATSSDFLASDSEYAKWLLGGKKGKTPRERYQDRLSRSKVTGSHFERKKAVPMRTIEKTRLNSRGEARAYKVAVPEPLARLYDKRPLVHSRKPGATNPEIDAFERVAIAERKREQERQKYIANQQRSLYGRLGRGPNRNIRVTPIEAILQEGDIIETVDTGGVKSQRMRSIHEYISSDKRWSDMKGPTYTASGIGDMLLGRSGETSKAREAEIQEQINKLQASFSKRLPSEKKEAMAERAEVVRLEEELAQLQVDSGNANMRKGALRGDVIHKIAELRTLKIIQEEDLKNEESLSKRVEEILGDATGKYSQHTEKLKGFKHKDVDSGVVLDRVKKLQELEKQAGLSGMDSVKSVSSEKVRAAIVEELDEAGSVVRAFKIAGTADREIETMDGRIVLGDIKSGIVDPVKAWAQINTLNFLRMAEGIDSASEGIVFQVPYSTHNKKEGAIQVRLLAQEMAESLILDAVKVSEGAETPYRIGEVPHTLMGGMETRIERDEKKGEEFPVTYVNNINMKDLLSGKNGLTKEVALAHFYSLPTEDQKRFLGALWSTKSYKKKGKDGSSAEETDYFYRRSATASALRKELPSFYRNIRQGDDPNFIRNAIIERAEYEMGEGEIASGMTVGGGYLSEWSKVWRTSDKRSANRVVNMFTEILGQQLESLKYTDVENAIKATKNLVGREQYSGAVGEDDWHNEFVTALEERIQAMGGELYRVWRGVDEDIGINELSEEVNEAKAMASIKKQGEVDTSRMMDIRKKIRQYVDSIKKTGNLEEKKQLLEHVQTFLPEVREAAKKVGGTAVLQEDEKYDPVSQEFEDAAERPSSVKRAASIGEREGDAQWLLDFWEEAKQEIVAHVSEYAKDKSGADLIEARKASVRQELQALEGVDKELIEEIKTFEKESEPISKKIEDLKETVRTDTDYIESRQNVANEMIILKKDLENKLKKNLKKDKELEDKEDRQQEIDRLQNDIESQQEKILALKERRQKTLGDIRATRIKELDPINREIEKRERKLKYIEDLEKELEHIASPEAFLEAQKEVEKILPNFQRDTNIHSDKHGLGEKTAHRFSWLYLAKEKYREAFQGHFNEFSERLTSEGVEPISQDKFMEMVLNPRQFEEYSISSLLQEQGANTPLVDLPLLLGKFKSEDYIQGGLVSNVIKSIKELEIAYPSEIVTDFFDTFSTQISPTEGEEGPARKMEYWDSLREKYGIDVNKILTSGAGFGRFVEEGRPFAALPAETRLETFRQESEATINALKDEIDKKSQKQQKRHDAVIKAKKRFFENYKKAFKEDKVTDVDKAIEHFDAMSFDGVKFEDVQEIYEEISLFAREIGIPISKNFLTGEQQVPSEHRERYDDLVAQYGQAELGGKYGAAAQRKKGLWGQRLSLLHRESPTVAGLEEAKALLEQTEWTHSIMKEFLSDSPPSYISEEKYKAKVGASKRTEEKVEQISDDIENQVEETIEATAEEAVQSFEGDRKKTWVARKGTWTSKREAVQEEIEEKIQEEVVQQAQEVADIVPLREKYEDEVSGGGSGTGGSGGGGRSEDREAQNERLREYIALMRQVYSLELDVFKLKNERAFLRSRGEDTGAIAEQITALQDLKKAIIEAQQGIKDEGAFSEKQTKRIKQEENILKGRERFDQGKIKSSLSTDQSARVERDFQALLRKRLPLEEKIASIKKNIALSYSPKEREALKEIEGSLEKQVELLDQQLNSLVDSGKMRPGQKKEILEAYELQYQAGQSRVAAQKQGSRTIWDMMANDMKRATMRIMDYGIAMKLLQSVPQTLNKIKVLTEQLDQALTNIRVVTGMTRKETEKLMITYQKLGKQLGATTVEIAQSSSEWLRQGYTVESVGKLIEASMKLSKLGMIEAQASTKFLTSALKGFKLEAAEAMSVVDKLTRVDQKAAVSAGSIAEALSRTATAAQIAGMSMDEAIGIVSTIGDVSQREMGSVGDAVRTMLSRYGNVKAGVFTQMGLDDDGETSENINDIEKVLGKLGIKIRTSSLEMRNITAVLDDLNDQWRTLDTVSKNAVATAFAGVRQRESFLIMMENYEKVKELTEESANSAGTAEAKYGAYMDSLEASMKRIANAWEKFTQDLASNAWIRSATKGIAFLTENMNLLVNSIGTLVAAYKLGPMEGVWGRLGGRLGIGGKGLDKSGRAVASLLDGTSGESKGKGSRFWRKLRGKDGYMPDAERMYAEEDEGKEKSSFFGKWIGKNARATQEQTSVLGAKYDEQTGVLRSIDAKMERVATTKTSAGSPVGRDGEDRLLGERPDRSTKKQSRKSRMQGGSAVALGAMAGVMTGLTTSESGKGIGSGIYNPSGQTVQTDLMDRMFVGIGAGAGAGVGGALGGPLGAMLGQVIGAELGKFASWVKNRDAINRKARVEEAGKQLEKLSEIKGTLEDYGALAQNDNWDTEDYRKAKGYVDELTDLLHRNVVLQDAFLEALAKVYDDTGKLAKADLPKTFEEAMDRMLNSADSEERKALSREAQIATLKDEQRADEIIREDAEYKSKQIRSKKVTFGGYWFGGQGEPGQIYGMDTIDTSYGAGGHIAQGVGMAAGTVIGGTLAGGATAGAGAVGGAIVGGVAGQQTGLGTYQDIDIRLAGTTEEEQIENLEKTIRTMERDGISDKRIQKLRDWLQEYREATAEVAKLAKDTREKDVKIGVLGSELTDLSREELSLMTFEGAVRRIGDAMAANGIEVKDASGAIKLEYIPAIEAAIKADDKLSILNRNQTKTYEDLYKARDRLNAILVKSGKTQKDLVDMLKYEGIEAFREFADEIKVSAEELENLVYTADEKNILQLASALNMTTGELEKMRDVLGKISLADTFGSLSEIRENFSGYLAFYKDIALDGQFAFESIEKILAEYPDVIRKLREGTAKARKDREAGLEDSSSLTEIIDYVREEAFGGSSAGFAAYKSKIFDMLLDSPDLTSDFKEDIKDLIGSLNGEMRDAINKTGKLSLIKDMLLTYDGEGAEELRKALYAFFDIDIPIEKDQSFLDDVAKKYKMEAEDQIKNLSEQKEALGKINDERKKELDLIKAKEALENAKKEKRRVYREGVGWVYEESEEAVSQAREKLEQLEVQKQQDDLQREIDRWEALKDQMDDLPRQKEIEDLNVTFDAWVDDLGAVNETQASIVAYLSKIYGSPDFFTLNPAKDTLGIESGGKYVDSEGQITEKPSSGGAGASQDVIDQKKREEEEAQKKRQKLIDDIKEPYESTRKAQAVIDTEYSPGKWKGQAEKYNEAYDSFIKKYDKALQEGVTKEELGKEFGEDIAGIAEQGKYSTSAPKQIETTGAVWHDWKKTFGFSDTPVGIDFIRTRFNNGKTEATGTRVLEFNSADQTWGKWEDAGVTGKDMGSYPAYSLIVHGIGSADANSYAYVGPDGKLYYLKGRHGGTWMWDAGLSEKGTKFYAKGTHSLPHSTLATINELGTEGIITPSGTLTALPSKTGIVPADITRNVWQLGEVAPTLIARLSSLNGLSMAPTSSTTTNNDGISIDTLNMEIYPTKDYDMDKFLAEAKTKARLTRQNN